MWNIIFAGERFAEETQETEVARSSRERERLYGRGFRHESLHCGILILIVLYSGLRPLDLCVDCSIVLLTRVRVSSLALVVDEVSLNGIIAFAPLLWSRSVKPFHSDHQISVISR